MTLGNIPIYKQKTAVGKPTIAPGQDDDHPFVIVGSGPAGLTLALDLARKGHQVVVLTTFDFISEGSKGICYAKQTLDIFDRLGVGAGLLKQGVMWNIGKVFWGDRPEPIYEFDMQSFKDQKNPGFINVQQYLVEDALIEALETLPNVEIRWGHTVKNVNIAEDKGYLMVSACGGEYRLSADYILACDGHKSHIRNWLGLDFEGRAFEDNFLIADIKLKHEHPSERYFWFDPPFNPGRTALLHKQPNDVWRLDFQLGWDIDREEAVKPENVEPYVKGMLGEDVEFEEEWYSVYTFQCRRMHKFIHGPVIFVGDSAHLVSPFGARGANSGIADAENLAWKLDYVLRNKAKSELLDTYNIERTAAADENILNSTRATDFMVPKNVGFEALRDSVLELASDTEGIRPYVNSGRLSTPTPYHNTSLSSVDVDDWPRGVSPGFVCFDAPMDDNSKSTSPWLFDQLQGTFTLICFGHKPPETDIKTIELETDGVAAAQYGATQGATYLVRPDRVVAARWKWPASAHQVNDAISKATSNTMELV